LDDEELKLMGLFAALTGAAIDRQDGGSGVKGAILGSLTAKAIGLAAPLAAIGAGVMLARQRSARTK
jgi:hypothetical protein